MKISAEEMDLYFDFVEPIIEQLFSKAIFRNRPHFSK